MVPEMVPPIEVAWDYKWILPRVREYLDLTGSHPMVGIPQIEEWIASTYEYPPGMSQYRIRHCISRALGSMDYKRRSVRGQTWDLMR